MADPQSNLVGRVVSWAGTANTQLISTGGTPRATFAYTGTAPSIAYLPHTSTGPQSAVSGLASWTVVLNMLLAIPQLGNNSLVTFASGHVLHADAFNIDIFAASLPATEYNATAPTFRSFIPGAFGWRGSWEGYLDDTTAITDIGAAGASGAAIFAYGINSGGNTLSLSGSIQTEGHGLSLQDGTANRYTYSFMGNGDLTHVGRTSGIVASATAILVPVTNSMVLSAGSGTRLSGALGFWTNINLRSRVADQVEVTVNVQGSGDPNIS